MYPSALQHTCNRHTRIGLFYVHVHQHIHTVCVYIYIYVYSHSLPPHTAATHFCNTLLQHTTEKHYGNYYHARHVWHNSLTQLQQTNTIYHCNTLLHHTTVPHEQFDTAHSKSHPFTQLQRSDITHYCGKPPRNTATHHCNTPLQHTTATHHCNTRAIFRSLVRSLLDQKQSCFQWRVAVVCCSSVLNTLLQTRYSFRTVPYYFKGWQQLVDSLNCSVLFAKHGRFLFKLLFYKKTELGRFCKLLRLFCKFHCLFCTTCRLSNCSVSFALFDFALFCKLLGLFCKLLGLFCIARFRSLLHGSVSCA